LAQLFLAPDWLKTKFSGAEDVAIGPQAVGVHGVGLPGHKSSERGLIVVDVDAVELGRSRRHSGRWRVGSSALLLPDWEIRRRWSGGGGDEEKREKGKRRMRMGLGFGPSGEASLTGLRVNSLKD